MTKNQEPIIFTFSGGINNRNTPIELYYRKQGECVNIINADTDLLGRLKLLRPLSVLNNTSVSSIHSIFRANDVIFVGAGTTLYYLQNGLTSLITGLSGDPISFAQVGYWIFLADGTYKKSIYIGGATPTACDWGLDIPSAAATVAVGAAGNPTGTYSCYYRYKITLPDGTIIRTDLSPVASIAVTNEKIEWSALVHASYTGATTNQIELFRFKTGWASTFLIATIDEGTTTYSDNIADAVAIVSTAYGEDGYYPPPDNINLVYYNPNCDRLFMAVDNNIYWTEAAKYNIVFYDTTNSIYTNTNGVYGDGEDITALEIMDEQLYIGSKKTWTRLRGTNPTYWTWESIKGATRGPLTSKSFILTSFGIVQLGVDGRFIIFNGFETSPFLDNFVFSTKPDTTTHMVFDGRFLRMFYNDVTYPSIIIDFLGFPNISPKVIKSTHNATASYYDDKTDNLYLGDSSGYIRNGDDENTSVTMSITTPDIPIGNLIDLDNIPTLLIYADTKGEDLTITPYYDGVEQDDLQAVNTDSLEWVAMPLPHNDYRMISFVATISTYKDIEIREPWIIKKEDDAT